MQVLTGSDRRHERERRDDLGLKRKEERDDAERAGRDHDRGTDAWRRADDRREQRPEKRTDARRTEKPRELDGPDVELLVRERGQQLLIRRPRTATSKSSTNIGRNTGSRQTYTSLPAPRPASTAGLPPTRR
jgi:hypothetical protein